MSDGLTFALITGASRGIGAAVATSLSAAGFGILLNYRSRQDAAEVVQARLRAQGGTAELLPFDVRDGTACADALNDQLQRGRRIGVVVNNAGIIDDAPLVAMQPQAWRDVTRTTLDGFYNVTQPLMMPMIQAKWGRIINISSVSGVLGTPGQVNYSAAKAGLIGATRSLAKELARRKITVNAVAPGLIDTEMIQALDIQSMTKKIPMRRVGRADEVAALVRFLVSDDAAYITGQVIGINGGLA